ncbi:MAG: hypothetical protein LBT38_12190 [Deltaproteobacteria bacterium]|jgi:hypothetical protein|nr:hypothetical protein [Deltaproteobacteria bacterium]
MSEDPKKPSNNNDPNEPSEPFDRLEFMREVRREFLAKLDLPENTKPERVLLMTRLKEEMAKIRAKTGQNH